MKDSIAPTGHHPYDVHTAISMRRHHMGIGFSPSCALIGHRRPSVKDFVYKVLIKLVRWTERLVRWLTRIWSR